MTPGGKLTHRLDVPMSESDMEALIALAAGVTKAEYARDVLRRVIWGEMSMMLRSVARSVRPGPSDDDGTTPLRPGREGSGL